MDENFSLSEVLGNVARDEKGRVTIEVFNLTTDPCLPKPNKTPDDILWPIYALLLGCLISCIVEAYVSRLRSRICNFYYPERAKERAAFLHKSIKSGRELRRNQLRMYMISK